MKSATSTDSTAKTVADGFGNTWECKHGLPGEWCCIEVVRPGKCQCVCDSGLEALLKRHYERGTKEEDSGLVDY